MQPTQQQETAIYTHDRNVIVVAGAGSGKTRVLVERYLALLEAHHDWPLNALVAITFTEKAAGEMRDRVRQTLETRAQSADTPERRAIWNERLGMMESARISTIHSLCATILRANAPEAGVDPQFEVLDEVDARLLLDDVIERVFQRLQDEGDLLGELFVEYETQAVHRVLVDQISLDVPELGENLFAGWVEQWEAEAVREVANLLTDPVFSESLNWLPERGWPQEDKLLDVWRAVWSLSGQLNEQTELSIRLDLLRILGSSETINLRSGSSKAWGDKETLAESKARLGRIRDMTRETLKHIGEPPGEPDQRAAYLLPLWANLIRRVQSAYRDTKEKDSLLDFDDLEQRTADLLRDFPLVRARYRNAEFKHILVDEFQDTNSRQWSIIQALADLERPGSLFVVGDPKQSIYAFRGADVSVFDRVKGEILTRGGTDVALARSFRTHHRLVAGFNYLFGQLLVRDAASPVRAFEVELGQPMESQRQPAPSEFPSLELLLVNKRDLEKGDDSPAAAARQLEAGALAGRLRDMVAQGLPIYDRALEATRPVQYGDMALLFQAMSNVTLYEEAFKAAGLPFVTVAGRGYYSRQEVWDLLNLLRALHNPADDLSLATALRSPLFSLSDDALFALRFMRDEAGERLPLWEALADPLAVPSDEVGRVAFARTVLYALRDRAGRVTIEELLHEALAQTGYLAILTALPDGARRRGNVEKLLEKARSSGQVTLGAFSRYLADLSEREVREGEALVDAQNAVTLMTVHASKGLEFPVVALVDASWERRNPSTAPLVYDPQAGLACRVYDEREGNHVDSYAYHRAIQLLALRETAERKRLLYVAATRAQDYLLVSGQVSQGNEALKAAGWLSWLLETLDLGHDDLLSGANIRDYPWGQAGITVIGRSAEEEDAGESEDVPHPARAEVPVGWEHPAVLNGEPLAGGLTVPPLVEPVSLNRNSVVRHLTATQIADLGSHDDFQRQHFRKDMLHSAPSHIRWGNWRRAGYIPQRILGDMVHEALRWWRFPTPDNNQLADVLESYAWEQGIVDDDRRERAVSQVQEMLYRTMQSDVYGWVQDALQARRPVYRELPFIYQYQSHIIHGVIDTLFQREDGSWTVVDYKTSFVEGYRQGDIHPLVEHARQYHLQVGVYATAAREQLRHAVGDDRIPAAYIHYIRYHKTVEVPQVDWQAALTRLEDRIGDFLDDVNTL